MGPRSLFVVWLMAAGCSSEHPTPFTAGTRLEAHVLDGGDGAVSFQTFFDTELGVDCTFLGMRDGEDITYRCLPTEGALTRFYLDASCTEPTLSMSGCSVPRYLTITTWDGTCGRPSEYAVYEVGAPVGGADVFSRDETGLCTKNPTPVPGLFAVAGELPTTRFVSAKSEDVAFGDRGLAARRLTADDGSSRTTALVDQVRGEECLEGFELLAGDYHDRCIPQTASMATAPAQYFVDSGCTSPAHLSLAAFDDACSPQALPELALSFERDGALACGQYLPLRIRPINNEAPVGPLFELSGGACVASGRSADSFHQLGDVIAPERFPLIEQKRVGSERIRVELALGEDGSPVFEHGEQLLDSQTGESCRVLPFEDGSRCVPNSVPDVSFFSDATCSQPVLESPPPQDPDCPPSERAPVGVVPPTCEAPARAVAFEETVTEADAFYGASGDCNTTPDLVPFRKSAGEASHADWAPITSRTQVR